MKRLRIIVTGDVQGVFYRFTTKQEAEKRGLKGFVQNEPDGSVLVLVEGDSDALDSLLEWLRSGPPMAEVNDLEIVEEKHTGEFKEFEVR